jgi:chemotaxis protein CheD
MGAVRMVEDDEPFLAVLGSCLFLVVYRPGAGRAGVAHLANVSEDERNPTHALLVEMIRALRLSRAGYRAKIVGGARILRTPDGPSLAEIGPRNHARLRAILDRERIPVEAEDCGGERGRRIQVHPLSGLVTIVSLERGTYRL